MGYSIFFLHGVTETWFKDDDCVSYDIEGHIKLENINKTDRVGEAAYILETLMTIAYAIILPFSMRMSNPCWLKYLKNIWMPINIVIGVIYRIPNTKIMDFNATMASASEQLRMENKLVYLMGDHIIGLLNSKKHVLTNEFVDVLYCNEFLALINRPTRITSTFATFIDNIFTNNHDDLSSLSGILVADIADRFPIFHITRSFSVEETVSCLVTRLYNGSQHSI